jgi:ribosomal protein S18 acetylase RimI-like enzyme
LTGAAAPATVALRPAGPADEPFLRALFAELRAAEFAPLDLEPAALDALLAMQFSAQDRAWRHSHPGGDFAIVLVDGRPAGRLYVDFGAEAIHVIDITLASEVRGRGVGTRLLRDVIARGDRTGRPVTLQTQRTNRALALYRRLGFTVTGEDAVYVGLRRAPAALS